MNNIYGQIAPTKSLTIKKGPISNIRTQNYEEMCIKVLEITLLTKVVYLFYLFIYFFFNVIGVDNTYDTPYIL